MVTWIRRYLLQELEDSFPNLTKKFYRVVSFPRWIDWRIKRYNCIAYAAGDNKRWWWPDPHHEYYWPQGPPRQETLPAFMNMLQLFGYRDCNHKLTKSDIYEQVAIYEGYNPFAQKITPLHVARQMKDGAWRSKLGKWDIIEHSTLECLNGYFPAYGRPIKFLLRKRRGFLHRVYDFFKFLC